MILDMKHLWNNSTRDGEWISGGQVLGLVEAVGVAIRHLEGSWWWAWEHLGYGDRFAFGWLYPFWCLCVSVDGAFNSAWFQIHVVDPSAIFFAFTPVQPAAALEKREVGRRQVFAESTGGSALSEVVRRGDPGALCLPAQPYPAPNLTGCRAFVRLWRDLAPLLLSACVLCRVHFIWP